MTLNFWTIFTRILMAILVGGIIGYERDQNTQSASIRTYMLVCLGASLVMMTNQYIYHYYGAGDPTRMAAQVVSGIGFLGAGTILVTKQNQVRVLTSAAGIWVSAALGLAIGVGFYIAALVSFFSIIAIMSILYPVLDYFRRRSQNLNAYVVFCNLESLDKLLQYLIINNIKLKGMHNDLMEYTPLYQANSDKDEIGCVIKVKLHSRINHEEFINNIRKEAGIRYAEELK